ncbi:MAG: sulfotransferase [Candidatus Promineifilaceae bacterium]
MVHSAEQDANLNTLGRYGLREGIIQQLANRLKLVEMEKQAPDLFRRPLHSPLIVIGFPRSGTTYLHRLLAADPDGRAIPLWELTSPLPEGKGVHLLTDPTDRAKRLKKMERQMKIRLSLNDNLDHKHFIRADSPEECMFMLGQTFHTMLYWVTAPVYSYVAWYDRQERHKKYQDYRRLLQVLQAVDPTKHLVLKAPAHTGGVGDLLELVPEANIIQTLRDPVTCMNSLNSLLATTQKVVTDQLDLHKMAQANLELMTVELTRNEAGRKKYPDRILDIEYEGLIADPIGTIKKIYDHFNLLYTAEFEAAMAQYIANNPKGKHGRHQYDSADFGLTDEAIRERIPPYFA